jgi:hypothetical protein
VTTNTGNDQVLVEGVDAGRVRRGGFTINTSHGDNKIAILDSEIVRNISITTGNDNDQVGLVDVRNASNITVRTGNGMQDQIGVAGVFAANITLDGGNSGRRAAFGNAEIGVTGSTFTGNLTIRTGIGNDQVGVGNNANLIAQVRGTVNASLPAGTAFAVEDFAGPVTVTGNVSVTTNNGDDGVLVEELGAFQVGRSGFTINAGNGDNRVGLVNSTIERNVSITTGSGSDQVGLVDVLGAANVTVRTGHGTLDQIGVAGVRATNITLDGGNSGRRVAQGKSEIGITDSIILNNLTIRTGIGDDMVAVGDHPALNEMIEPWKDPATLEEPDSDVNVASSVSISTNSGDDGVWIHGLTGSANVTINTGNGDDEIGVVDSTVSGNIRVDTGNSTSGGADQVGLIRVTVANLTVNNSLGNAGFGLAEVNAADVSLNGGNSVNRTNANFGYSWIGVTNSTMANLTIRQGHPPDEVLIGIHEDIETNFQIPDPASEVGESIAYQMGTVTVNGTVRVDSNTPGRVSYDDVVRISHLQAQVLRVNTGLGNDEVAIGEGMNVTQEFRVAMSGGSDTLLLEVADPAAFVAGLPANAVIDGGSGTDTLKKNNISSPRWMRSSGAGRTFCRCRGVAKFFVTHRLHRRKSAARMLRGVTILATLGTESSTSGSSSGCVTRDCPL